MVADEVEEVGDGAGEAALRVVADACGDEAVAGAWSTGPTRP